MKVQSTTLLQFVLALSCVGQAAAEEAGRSLYSYYYYHYYSPSSYYYSSYYYNYYNANPSKTITGGAIAGIVIGSICCGCFITFLLLVCLCTRKVVVNGQMVREWKCCPKTQTIDPNDPNYQQQMMM